MRTVRRVVERRPADHVEFVIVAEAVYVAACVEQRTHSLKVPLGGSPV